MSTARESLADEPILDIQPYEPGKPVQELARALRITVGTTDEDGRLVEALRMVLAQKGTGG